MTQSIVLKQTQHSSQLSFSIQAQKISQSFTELCNKHKDRKGEFYQSQYPWIRYCESCALNLALCGKKIQKCLNSQQMFNKVKLGNILKSITSSIKQCEKAHEQQSLMSSKLQQYRQHFSLMIRQIDSYVSQIMQTRAILQQNIQKYLNKYIKEMLQRQSLVIGKKMSLINEKSRIQCDFAELISKQNKDYIDNIISRWQQLAKEMDGMKLKQEKISQITTNINQLGELFSEKISAIKMMKIDMLGKGQQINMPLKKLHVRTQPTNPTQEDEQLSDSLSGRIHTAYSTIQHSALISPCCELDSSSSILQQKEQNSNKITRTSLQLKVRCKSKSGQKKKVEIYVKEGAQNLTKKKV